MLNVHTRARAHLLRNSENRLCATASEGKNQQSSRFCVVFVYILHPICVFQSIHRASWILATATDYGVVMCIARARTHIFRFQVLRRVTRTFSSSTLHSCGAWLDRVNRGTSLPTDGVRIWHYPLIFWQTECSHCVHEFRMRRRRWSINSQSQSHRHVSPFRDETEQRAECIRISYGLCRSIACCLRIDLQPSIWGNRFDKLQSGRYSHAFSAIFSLSRALALSCLTNEQKLTEQKTERKKGDRMGKNLISMASFSVRSLVHFVPGRVTRKNKLFSMGPIVVIAHCILQLVSFFTSLVRSSVHIFAQDQ